MSDTLSLSLNMNPRTGRHADAALHLVQLAAPGFFFFFITLKPRVE